MLLGAKYALAESYQALLQLLRTAEDNFGKVPRSVQLVSVSKTYPAEDVCAAAELCQPHFGENQLQDAMQKISKFDVCA